MSKPEVLRRGSNHYKTGEIEPIEYIFAQGLGVEFCIGNVIKYVTRCKHSNKMKQDLEKAKHYIDFLLNHLETENEKEQNRREKEDSAKESSRAAFAPYLRSSYPEQS